MDFVINEALYSVQGLIAVLQGLLIVVLLITIGINIMFILDTSRRLHDEVQTTGEKFISDL
jgi:hypothetical protein